MELGATEIATPLGSLKLIFANECLCGLSFDRRWERLERYLCRRFSTVKLERGAGNRRIVERLEAYFGGEILAIDDVAVETGGSPFQEKVWQALRRIPAGRTTSYGELAASIGQPTGARAVATANATNPVAIVVPCHRVIHADGSISGYGGGVKRKRWLLRHEAEHSEFRLEARG